MEEQRLADRRLHRFRLEGLGDQEGRLGTLAGQQALGLDGLVADDDVDAARAVLDGEVTKRGAIGPVEAFGVPRLTELVARAGITLD